MNKVFDIQKEFAGLSVAIRKDCMNYLEREVRFIVENALYQNYSAYLARKPIRDFITFEEIKRSVVISTSYTPSMVLSVWIDEEKFLQNNSFRERLYTAASVENFKENYEQYLSSLQREKIEKDRINRQWRDWFWNDIFDKILSFIKKDFYFYVKKVSQIKNRR